MPLGTHSLILFNDAGDSLSVEVEINPLSSFGTLPAAALQRLGVAPIAGFAERGFGQIGQVKAMLGANSGSVICHFGEEGSCLGFHNLASLFLQLNEAGTDLEPLVIHYHEHPRLLLDV